VAERAFDLVVIGAGPGGYVAAIRAAQLGLQVACVDENEALGGTCLRVGCIPSKALLESSERLVEARERLAEHGVLVSGIELDLKRMLARKDAVVDKLVRGVAALFRKHRVNAYRGRARLAGGGAVEVRGEHETTLLRGRHVILATGSVAAAPPFVAFDGARVGTSTDALSYPEVPEHLVVIGAGYIGLELGSVWRRLGARVTVLEVADRILLGMDRELAVLAQRAYERQGIAFSLGARVSGVESGERSSVVRLSDGSSLSANRVLVAVGRRPNTEGLGLAEAGVALDDRGRVVVDGHFRTSAADVYAIGDLVAGPMLAHKASEEAVACVERLVTGYGHVNYDAIPGVVYTHPELASVGKTEDELVASGVPYRKGVFPFSASGRARAMGDAQGQVKMLAHAATDRVLGVHVIGPRAGDLIAEAAVGMELGASAEDIARSSHAHPTLAEAVKEAALAVSGRPLHV
jgi:dihydrolipoamide dehydrogenase